MPELDALMEDCIKKQMRALDSFKIWCSFLTWGGLPFRRTFARECVRELLRAAWLDGALSHYREGSQGDSHARPGTEAGATTKVFEDVP